MWFLLRITIRLMRRNFILFIIVLLLSKLTFAQKRTYQTLRTNNPPTIDGRLDDDAWGLVNWASDFKQREPHSGADPSQKTAFKILYDDDNLYLAIKLFDTDPTSIEKRMTKRDLIDGDQIYAAFDSYDDDRTAFVFGVNAAGVQSDMLLSNDNTDTDPNWNAVYQVKVSIDEEGWNAEFKIPLSQLRFANIEELTWGLQIFRVIFKTQENTIWQYIPLDSPGWVSEFGDLLGMNGVKPKLDTEIIPYTVLKMNRFEREDGNPYATGKSERVSIGIDGKVSLTNDLTLNFTINPDFGQVEADPSVVNLTAFESFFEEKRPFFIEGNNIFSFPLANGGPFQVDNLLYTRRIGRYPHYEPDIANNEYLESATNTNILAAFKLSGKTKRGVSIGVMESMTPRTFSKISDGNNERKEAVEPFTNYFLSRFQKDFNKGTTTIGGMLTATNRKIEDETLDYLPKSAYTGGIDFTHSWKNRTYNISFKTFFSLVSGSTEAITELQEAPARYYQRPNATHLGVDTARTSLMGHGGIFQFNKSGNGHLSYSFFVNWRSPGLDVNDIGYIQRSDEIQQVAWASYRWFEPFSVFRSLNFDVAFWTGWDFGGKNIYKGGNFSANTQFKNYWRVSGNLNKEGASFPRTELRGGPSLKVPGVFQTSINIHSDNRKKLSVGFNGSLSRGDNGFSNSNHFGIAISYRATDAFSISLNPNFSNSSNELQYIETIEFNGDQYIMGKINSKQFSAAVRIDYSLTPDFSIQYYAQPFIFAANYTELKKITNSTADNYNDRFHLFNPNEITFDAVSENYQIDENVDGIVDFEFENPNFNFFQFRSNLVARWEYSPGSSLYLVWAQGRTGDNSKGQYHFRDDFHDLSRVYPENIFLLKFSYRIVYSRDGKKS